MICFDTMLLIWGVQGTATLGQEDMIVRTKRYIRYLAEKRTKIMIPAPVVTEYLLGFGPQDAKVQHSLIEQYFYVPSFDLPAARLAAELLRNRQVTDAIRAEHGIGREQLRNDAQILAVAITNSAEKVISTDPQMARLAQGRIPVVGVPKIEDQLELFE